MRSKIQLKVVTRDEKPLLPVLEIDPPETRFFYADGPYDFLCGKCNTVLAQAIQIEVLKKCLLKCNQCQSLNVSQ